MNLEMSDRPDTSSLIDRARQGDPDAWDTLVGGCRPRLESHIQMRVGSHLRRDVGLEDVYQDTLIQALRSIKEWLAELGIRKSKL